MYRKWIDIHMTNSATLLAPVWFLGDLLGKVPVQIPANSAVSDKIITCRATDGMATEISQLDLVQPDILSKVSSHQRQQKNHD